MPKVTSTEIKKALDGYHPKDYFLTECKTCSTYFPNSQGMLKFDGLAMTRSYTSPCITGYEIKVSRSDFLGDNKWHLYLQYCNEFYFVVPVGLVAKDEIPENVGLIYYYPETGKLLKKRRAVYRKIEEPVGVYKYIIYSRLDQERIPFYEDRAEYARAYLEDRADKQAIGRRLGSKIATELSDTYCRLADLKETEDRLRLLDILLKVMKENGIYCWNHEGYAEKLDAALKSKAAPDDLKYLKKDLEAALNIVNQMQKGESNGN